MKQRTFRESMEDRIAFLENILDTVEDIEETRKTNILREIEKLNNKMETVD
jgi:hypothetical protein